MISLRQVTKIYYNGKCPTSALQGVDLEIEKGEYIAIMGTSGSGKSTLLNIIGGMDNLTEGEYFYNDISVHQLKGNDLHLFRKNNVSFIFQQFALMSHYTVFENVEVPLLAKGIVKKERKEIVISFCSFRWLWNVAQGYFQNVFRGAMCGLCCLSMEGEG